METLAALPRDLMRKGDVIVVSAGGRSPRTLQSTVAAARTFPHPVYLSCSLDRLGLSRELAVDKTLVTWEPSAVDDWDWGFDRNLERVDFTLPKTAGLIVTAVPLNPRRGLKWHYEELSATYQPLIVQTQGMIYRSSVSRLLDKIRGNTPFEEACKELFSQHYGSTLKLARVGFQVAFNGDSRVSPEQAYRATMVASTYGINSVYVFGLNAASNRKYLQLLRGV